MRRSSMNKSHSRAVFTTGAKRVHGKNVNAGFPMRGGIRL